MSREKIQVIKKITIQDAFGGKEEIEMVEKSFFGIISSFSTKEIFDGQYKQVENIMVKSTVKIDDIHLKIFLIEGKKYKITAQQKRKNRVFFNIEEVI